MMFMHKLLAEGNHGIRLIVLCDPSTDSNLATNHTAGAFVIKIGLLLLPLCRLLCGLLASQTAVDTLDRHFSGGTVMRTNQTQTRGWVFFVREFGWGGSSLPELQVEDGWEGTPMRGLGEGLSKEHTLSQKH